MSALPPVVGINFGNSYASIAVFTKDNVAECIANQDGERQIACAIAFIGQEVYIGNQAKPHLIKHASNTILGFRDLLGISYGELPPHLLSGEGPQQLVQHPDERSTPAWKLQVLQPAPSPLPLPRPPAPSATSTMTTNTPNPSALATPASEPVPTTRYITPLEACSLFLHSLGQSAEDFLGKRLAGAVITVPGSFTKKQRSALLQAAKDASIPVLQLLDEAGAASLTTLSSTWCPTNPLPQDRTQLLIDVGHSSTTLTLLALREGLILPLASSTCTIGGHTLDDLLLKHFATEFMKKTKTSLDSKNTAKDPADARSIRKLLLALEHTKRTISASTAAASVSIESLKSGIDFTTTINRLRFDLLARPFYMALSSAVVSLLDSTQPPTDPTTIDEIVYVGGTASLPGLDEHLAVSCGFNEEIETAFKRGEVVGGGVGDPTTILSRGCAYQALLVSELAVARSPLVDNDGENGNGGNGYEEILAAFQEEEEGAAAAASSKRMGKVPVASRTIGLVFPRDMGGAGAAENGDAHPGPLYVDELTKSAGGVYLPLIVEATPLPARRAVDLVLNLPRGYGKKVVVELWEVEEGIKVEKRKPRKELDDEDVETIKDGGDEEEEEEEEEVKHQVVKKLGLVGVLEVPIGKESGEVTVSIKAVRGVDGRLFIEAWQAGRLEGGKVVLQT